MAKTYENRAIAETVRKRLERGKGKPYAIVEWVGGYKVLPQKEADIINAPLPEFKDIPMSQEVLDGVANLKAKSNPPLGKGFDYASYEKAINEKMAPLSVPMGMLGVSMSDMASAVIKDVAGTVKDLAALYDDKKKVETVAFGLATEPAGLKTAAQKIEVLVGVIGTAHPWLETASEYNIVKQEYELIFGKNGHAEHHLVMPKDFVEDKPYSYLIEYVLATIPEEMLVPPNSKKHDPKNDVASLGHGYKPGQISAQDKVHTACKVFKANYPWIDTEFEYNVATKEFMFALIKKGFSTYAISMSRSYVDSVGPLNIAETLKGHCPEELLDPTPFKTASAMTDLAFNSGVSKAGAVVYYKIKLEDGSVTALKASKPMQKALKKLEHKYLGIGPIPIQEVKDALYPLHIGLDMGSKKDKTFVQHIENGKVIKTEEVSEGPQFSKFFDKLPPGVLSGNKPHKSSLFKLPIGEEVKVTFLDQTGGTPHQNPSKPDYHVEKDLETGDDVWVDADGNKLNKL